MNFTRRLLLSSIAAISLVAGPLSASAADLIAIITPSPDNPFFKAEAGAGPGGRPALRACR